MNIQIIMLLACLLCAESPAGTVLERHLMAETIVYRATVKSSSIEEVVYAPAQFAGVQAIDLDGYRLYRPRELMENMSIAMAVLQSPAVAKVSNFARTGTCNVDKPCEWEQRCEVVAIEGRHTFYVCPDWH